MTPTSRRANTIRKLRGLLSQEFTQFKIIEPMLLIIDDDHMQFVAGNKAEMMKPKRKYKEKRVQKEHKEEEPMLIVLMPQPRTSLRRY